MAWKFFENMEFDESKNEKKNLYSQTMRIIDCAYVHRGQQMKKKYFWMENFAFVVRCSLFG